MHAFQRRLAFIPAAGLALAIAASTFAGLRPATPAFALTNCTVADNSFDSEEAAFLVLINNYRAQNGLSPLVTSTNLNRAATWLAVDMATKSYFSHTDSLGRSPSTRAQNCDYPAGAGENIAAGTVKDTAAEAFEMWRLSSGHNANMLTGGYTTIGIARYYLASSPYSWYWVTNFGYVNDGTGGGTNPTATPTRTATRTSTVAATATRTPTRTTVAATATRTATRTSTAIATATRTSTPVPTATRTTVPSLVKAAVTSPAPGSTLPGATTTFSWTTGSGALEYFVYAGATAGSNSYFGRSTGLSTSQSVANLPVNGSTVYVRLWTRFAAGWQFTDYSYTASTGGTTGTTAKAQMTSPVAGSRLGTSATFAWTAATGAAEYYLYVGASPGAVTYHMGSTGLTRSRSVTGLPSDGSTIYVRLWTRTSAGWTYTDYSYLAAAQ